MAKQEDINSRPNEGKDLELAHQTKFHCADCGGLSLIWTKNTHSENHEKGCSCQPKLWKQHLQPLDTLDSDSGIKVVPPGEQQGDSQHWKPGCRRTSEMLQELMWWMWYLFTFFLISHYLSFLPIPILCTFLFLSLYLTFTVKLNLYYWLQCMVSFTS